MPHRQNVGNGGGQLQPPQQGWPSPASTGLALQISHARAASARGRGKPGVHTRYVPSCLSGSAGGAAIMGASGAVGHRSRTALVELSAAPPPRWACRGTAGEQEGLTVLAGGCGAKTGCRAGKAVLRQAVGPAGPAHQAALLQCRSQHRSFHVPQRTPRSLACRGTMHGHAGCLSSHWAHHCRACRGPALRGCGAGGGWLRGQLA